MARRPDPLIPLLILLVLAAPAAAEKPDQEPASTFEGRADVIRVEVPLNVVTKDGEPVTDLRAEDFEVFDEGEPQEVIGFEAIDLGRLDEVAASERLEELPSVARRNFLLLFDFSFSGSSSIVKARRAAHDFVLNSLHPTDLVAIATFSLEFGPQLLVTFTPDRAQLARAIDTLGLTRRPGGGEFQDPLRFIFEPPTSSAASLGDGATSVTAIREDIAGIEIEALQILGRRFERSELSYERSRITAWSRAMADMAKALNSVAGRKHVVYFSEGFDSSLLLGRRPEAMGEEFDQEMRNQGQLLFSRDSEAVLGDTLLQADVNEMLEEFRRADCVIQAVDVAGLRGEVEAVHGRSKGVDGLFYIANETGGELYEATNNLGNQLGRVLQRSEVTYVLSFEPKDIAWDGAYHRLKVKVNGMKGARLSHRAGYYAPRPFTDLDPLEKSLLASDAIASANPRSDVRMDVLAAPFRANDALAYVPVIVEVQGVSVLQGQRSGELALELYGYATNDQGEMRDFFSQQASFDVRGFGAKIRESGVKFYSQLELEPGEYLLRVLVRNAETGRTGVVASPLTVPSFAAAETTLLPPFFRDEPVDKWLLLRHQEESGAGTVVYPFTLKGVPFVPSARPALERGEPVELCLMTYNLGPGRPAIEAKVVSAEGDESPGDVEFVERTITGIAGFDKLVTSFNPKGLERGEYMLEVSLTDPQSGVLKRESIAFVVN